jgi:hypothetical protein
VVALLAVGACDGGGEDPPAPSTSTSTSSSVSSSTSSPSTTTAPATVDPASLPPEARKHTPEGAAAFVKYYLQQVNEAWTKPVIGLLPPLSDKGCVTCKSFEDQAAALVTKKHRYATAPATYRSFTPYDGAPSGRQYVRVLGTQHKVNVVDASGETVSTDAEKPIAVSAMTVWQGGQWLLFDMG